MTPWQVHVARWRDCIRCPLHEGRRSVVLARGSLPCDILFVGEAPGQSEDVLGEPFVGPAGQLLDRIVSEALTSPCMSAPLRIAFTNVVACFPREAKQTDDHAPPREAVKACRPRLQEFIVLAKPRLVVFVGSVADRAGSEALGKATTLTGGRVTGHATVKLWASIQHPAAILRAPTAGRSLMVRRAVIRLQKAFEQLGNQ